MRTIPHGILTLKVLRILDILLWRHDRLLWLLAIGMGILSVRLLAINMRMLSVLRMLHVLLAHDRTPLLVTIRLMTIGTGRWRIELEILGRI